MPNSKFRGLTLLALVFSLLIPHFIKIVSADSDSEQVGLSGLRQAPTSRQQLAALDLLNRDDYHSNVDLEDIIQSSPRYSLLDGRFGGAHLPSQQEQPMWLGNLWSNDQLRAAGRFSRSPFNERNSFGQESDSLTMSKKQQQTQRQLLDGIREDKDYSFVGGPTKPLVSNQEFASRASIWASDIIGDYLKTRQNQRAQKRIRAPNQLSQQIPGTSNNIAGGSPSNEIDANEKAMTREKKRRCKEDRNLSIKHPSFCDTDAYFGAADYSMRDVWDSAGR